MSNDRTPITGPIPLHVETTPTAVVLDMQALTRLVVADVLDALLNPEDTGTWDRLQALAEQPAATDTRLPFEELVEQLADAASSKVPLYGTKALELAELLSRAAGPKPVPHQLRRAS
ncbi:hypothetical protein ACF09L_32875 [Streptomyces sp. NPDC014779]|uniref:hypothetical protein n=1 Tax=Streptomyces sp. NPDC014779 TaxID=3364911 RepID=UPI0036FCA86A